MAKIRRILRSVEKPAPTGFDSQYWPILIAIAILFGFLMGTVLTLLSGIWLWFSLLAIPVLIFSTTISLHFVDDRRLKRSTQLALIVSLIVHLGMLLSAHHWHLFGDNEAVVDPSTEQRQMKKKPAVVPIAFETHQWQQSQAKVLPKPVEKEVEQKKTEREIQNQPQKKPTPVDQSQRQAPQNQNQKRQTQQTVPKQSPTLSKLTRSNLKTQPKSGTQVSQSQRNSAQRNPDRKENQPATLTAKNTEQQKRQASSNSLNKEASVDVSTQKSSTASRPSFNRRKTEIDQPKTQSQKINLQLRRSTIAPAQNPVAAQATKSSQPVANPAPTSKPTLKPVETKVARTSRNRQTDQPTQQAPSQSNAQRQAVKEPLASRKPNLQPNPKIAQAPSSRSRSAQPTQVPSTTVMESPRRVVQAPKTSTQLNPRTSNTTVSRSTNVSEQPSQVQIQAPNQQLSAVTQAATKASRRPNETLPSVTPNANPDPLPRRSNNTSPKIASATTVESPSKSTSQSQVAKSEGQPKTTTLRRSTNGTTGIGQSTNLLSDAPTSPKPSLIASDSAVRKNSTQTTPEDTAFRPIQSAQVRRSRADRSSPSAEMKVENSPIAKLAGSANPAQLNAQSSASKITAASNARNGQVNAAQGSSTIDTGATKLVSESGQSRASGGGQPDIDQEIQTATSERSRSGETANNSLAANVKADVSQAPAELGGGKPSENNPDPNSTSLARTVAGDRQDTLAGPTSAATSGPTQVSSSAPTQAAATLARTAPSETAENELQPGGGEPNQNLSLNRIRPQLTGGNTNTKVTFSGRDYSSREEGSKGIDAAAGTRLAGGNDTTIENRTTNNDLGTGAMNTEELLARGSEKSAHSLDGGSLSRQAPSDDAGSGEDIGSTGRQLASNRRQGGLAGPKTNSTVKLSSNSGAADKPTTGLDATQLAGLAGSGSAGVKRREQTGGQMVDLDVNEGPGGLGSQIEADTGINSRRARLDSNSIELKVDTRFQRKDAAGQPKINTTAIFSKGAFKGRDQGKPGASGPSTEPSIELGLSWLAAQQRAPGNWSLSVEGVPEDEAAAIAYETPTAATGLALLAFQGAGYNHKEYKYADSVNQGIQWLISNQQEDGCLYVDTNPNSNDVCRLYSHGIAAIALCEAYGMTNDPEVKEAAQKALNYIAKSQDKTLGGWRYIPGSESDTSVTGWMVMALKSGKLAGLSVDSKTLKLVQRWLGFASSRKAEHQFSYNPKAKNTDQYPDREVKGKTPTTCMTAVGLLLRLYSGWNRTDERMVAGAKELLKTMPSETTIEARNTYYWYYATQVLKHVGGEDWDTWYQKSLYPLLIESQQKTGPMQGSWDPRHPVPDRWGYFSGRLYVTTLNLLTLEVKWRLLPLYDDSAK